MYNPVELGELIKRTVCKSNRRKYYRFRPSRFYGGISTADSVGCCLRCVFCWSWNVVTRTEEIGTFYSPEEVVQKLTTIARKKNLNLVRISGNEPTICRPHLIEVLGLIPDDYVFILETNGILIGNDPTYARELSIFHNLSVRVSLKGTCEEEFSRLTGAVPEGFQLQLRALEHLQQNGVRVHPACMTSFSTPNNVSALKKRLMAIHPVLEDLEIEELILYPAVQERLEKRKVSYFSGHKPDNMPPAQIWRR